MILRENATCLLGGCMFVGFFAVPIYTFLRFFEAPIYTFLRFLQISHAKNCPGALLFFCLKENKN